MIPIKNTFERVLEWIFKEHYSGFESISIIEHANGRRSKLFYMRIYQKSLLRNYLYISFFRKLFQSVMKYVQCS
jgi:ribosomal protein L19